MGTLLKRHNLLGQSGISERGYIELKVAGNELKLIRAGAAADAEIKVYYNGTLKYTYTGSSTSYIKLTDIPSGATIRIEFFHVRIGFQDAMSYISFMDLNGMGPYNMVYLWGSGTVARLQAFSLPSVKFKHQFNGYTDLGYNTYNIPLSACMRPDGSTYNDGVIYINGLNCSVDTTNNTSVGTTFTQLMVPVGYEGLLGSTNSKSHLLIDWEGAATCKNTVVMTQGLALFQYSSGIDDYKQQFLQTLPFSEDNSCYLYVPPTQLGGDVVGMAQLLNTKAWKLALAPSN